MRQGGWCSVCWEICLDQLMGKELTWEVPGWWEAKTLLTWGSWRACREFVLWQKNDLIGPRRRQQPNFFNASPFTLLTLFGLLHIILLCSVTKWIMEALWRNVWVLSLLSKLSNPLSFSEVWRDFVWIFALFSVLLLVCCLPLLKIPCLVCIYCLWQSVSYWCAKNPSRSWFWNTDAPVSVPLHKSDQGNCCLSTVYANFGSETEWCFHLGFRKCTSAV